MNLEERNRLKNILSSGYGRSGGRSVTNVIKGLDKESEIYSKVSKLEYAEDEMTCGYGVTDRVDDKNIRKHIGVVTEQLLRVYLSRGLDTVDKYKLCFIRMLRSANSVGMLDDALEICDKINDNNNISLDNMYVLSRFSDAEADCANIGSSLIARRRATEILNSVKKCSLVNALNHKKAKGIIAECLNRCIAYFTAECKVKEYGVVLGGYGNITLGGEIDIITKNSVVDLKVKDDCSIEDIMQILTYARILKTRERQRYRGVKYARLVNPYINKIYTYELKKVPKEVWEIIDTEIIGL